MVQWCSKLSILLICPSNISTSSETVSLCITHAVVHLISHLQSFWIIQKSPESLVAVRVRAYPSMGDAVNNYDTPAAVIRAWMGDFSGIKVGEARLSHIPY